MFLLSHIWLHGGHASCCPRTSPSPDFHGQPGPPGLGLGHIFNTSTLKNERIVLEDINITYCTISLHQSKSHCFVKCSCFISVSYHFFRIWHTQNLSGCGGQQYRFGKDCSWLCFQSSWSPEWPILQLSLFPLFYPSFPSVRAGLTSRAECGYFEGVSSTQYPLTDLLNQY